MEVKVKTYPNTATANRDARRMVAAGWEPQGMSGGGTRYSLSKSINTKAWASAVLGPLGLFATSRAKEPVTITWIRTPKPAEHKQISEIAGSQQPPWTVAVGSNALEELAKASALHGQGVLPDEQFEAMKKRLIAQIAADEDRVAKEAAAERELQAQQVAKKRASTAMAVYRRPDIWTDRNRRYRIVVDDKEVGKIGADQRLSFDVSEVRHRVIVKIDYCSSNELLVTPQFGETVELICSSTGHPFLKALFRRKAYLNLDVGPDPMASADSVRNG